MRRLAAAFALTAAALGGLAGCSGSPAPAPTPPPVSTSSTPPSSTATTSSAPPSSSAAPTSAAPAAAAPPTTKKPTTKKAAPKKTPDPCDRPGMCGDNGEGLPDKSSGESQWEYGCQQGYIPKEQC